MTQDATRQRFSASVEKFFRLENTAIEWDMFCHLNALDHKVKERSILARHRDRLFKVLLFRRHVAPDVWLDRFEEWESHLTVYFELMDLNPGAIAAPTSSPPARAHGTRRIDRLFGHLAVLDSKFSMLLTVNTTMLGAFTLTLTQLRAYFVFLGFPATRAGFVVQELIEAPLFLLLSLLICGSLFNLWHALRGFRRIVWGDLDGYENDPIAGERAQTDYLIISVARRTNLFRVIAHVTKQLYFGVVMLAVSLLVCGSVRTVLNSYQQAILIWHR